MHGRRVTDAGADRRGAQMLARPVALAAAHDVLVKDMAGPRTARWQDERQPSQAVMVTRSNRLAAPVVGLEARQYDREDRRLDRIDAGVDAHAGADITLAPAIFADLARRRGERRIAGRDDAGIAERAEVFLSGRSGLVTATIDEPRGGKVKSGFHAATASCHCAAASARKVRSVDRETRCRCRSNVLWTAAWMLRKRRDGSS
jgi:hypothetical protein